MNKTAESACASLKDHVSRRRFLCRSTAVLSGMMVAPHLVRGAEANRKISVGLVGCGSRGAWIGGLFKEHGGYEVTACADYFSGAGGRVWG